MFLRPPGSTLFPYTTLFRSRSGLRPTGRHGARRRADDADGRHMDGEHAAASAHRPSAVRPRTEEHTSELQSHSDLVCRLLLEKKKKQNIQVDNNTTSERTCT